MSSRARLVAWTAQAAALALARSLALVGRSPRRKIERILVLGYNAIGDLIMFLPALAAIRKAHPEATIVFVADQGATTGEIVPASGLVDEVVIFNFQTAGPKERAEINDTLKTRDFDAVVLSLPTPAEWFIPVLATIPLRVGHRSRLAPPSGEGFFWSVRRALVTAEWARRMLLDVSPWVEPGMHSTRRALQLAAALGGETPDMKILPVPPAAKSFAEKALGPKRSQLRAAVHLGVPDNPYGKIWSAERFGKLIAKLEAKGVECILVGGKGESAAVATARAASGQELRSWAGECSLLETFALIGACDVFIGCDTGLAKAAAAQDIPTATIWGPTDPAELGPGEDGPHLDIRRDIFCSPCVRQGMPYARATINYLTCGNRACLTELGEGEVFSALSAWPALRDRGL